MQHYNTPLVLLPVHLGRVVSSHVYVPAHHPCGLSHNIIAHDARLCKCPNHFAKTISFQVTNAVGNYCKHLINNWVALCVWVYIYEVCNHTFFILLGLGLGPRGHGRGLQAPVNKAGHKGDTGYGSSAQRSHGSLQTSSQ